MTTDSQASPIAALTALGWSDFFQAQVEPHESNLVPARINTLHRSRLTGITSLGPVELSLPVHSSTRDFTVGDWVLADPQTGAVARCLSRRTVLVRRAEGSGSTQLAAANVDTLFIVTSCNEDFNPARLERYLAFANEGGADPVIVLTKADKIPDAGSYQTRAAALQRGLAVVTLNPKVPEAASTLAPWCGVGQTVALVGSSGVGKSTLVNTLAGPGQVSPQQTGAIREQDGKGRHTTTARSLHAMVGGGWVIDTPGIRTLHVGDTDQGIETVFAEITELTPDCKFRDCTHSHEPGCAIQAALADGRLDPERVTRWRKLVGESRNAPPRRKVGKGGGS